MRWGGSWARRQAARVDAEVVEIDGSHSPFFARPNELAEVFESAY
ncbi:hypothetical protein [Mycobacterium asiaticum]|nr:hypothetical protein [Mycobacterium asiaticum]